MAIKLLALDLDGTIVNHQLTISERTQALVKHLCSHTDVKVVVATGRMFPSALPFVHQLGLATPVITYQGAMICEPVPGTQNGTQNGEPNGTQQYKKLYHQPIPLDVAKALLQWTEAENLATNLYINDILYINHHNPHATYYSRTAGVEPVSVPSLEEVLNDPPSKMMVIDDTRVDEIIMVLREKFGERIGFCRSRSNFCEMIDGGVSKWRAIEELMRHWNIAKDEVMTIGDQENDLAMIQNAGIGVAMGNAPGFVKEVAAWVTDSIDEDGAAKAIERFVLETAVC